jgi:biopolymer transport protein ExbD
MTHAWRRRNAQSLYESHYGPNMTPMVDVVMVILIFFMASTAFLGPEWFLKTHLPRAGATPAANAQDLTRLRVTLSQSPENQTLATVGVLTGLTMDQLDAKIAEEAKRATPDNVVVLIDPAPGVPYDDVVKVHEMCARAGVTKAGLAP